MELHPKFFYYTLCHYCKNLLKDYKRCGACKSVYYCCKSHQTLDWKEHKHLCRVITRTRLDLTIPTDCTFKEWHNLRLLTLSLWETNLKRALYPFECQICMFPRICPVCLQDTDLQNCLKCNNVAYCSASHSLIHKSTHDPFCAQLILCMKVDCHLHEGNSYPSIDHDRLIKLLPAQNMQELIEPAVNDVDVALISDIISPGATIYCALDYVQNNSSQLIIHVVGSANREATLDWRIVAEMIFHSRPLQKIVFVLIGPDAWLLTDDFPAVEFIIIRKRYAEVVGSLPSPNLVVAFNSGLHEMAGQNSDDWRDSLPFLVQNKGIPFVFTCYTQDELKKDMECLQRLEIELDVVFCGENAFGSLRPLRDWSYREAPVFYADKFMGVVKRI